jgi:hypothetical protein
LSEAKNGCDTSLVGRRSDLIFPRIWFRPRPEEKLRRKARRDLPPWVVVLLLVLLLALQAGLLMSTL